MKIEAGSLEESAGRTAPIADVAQLKDKIEQGVYGPDDDSSCALKAAAASGSNIIAVTAECADPSAAKDALSGIAQAIIAEHEKMIDARRQMIENQIKNYEANAKEIKNSLQYSADRSCSTERYLAASDLENRIIELEFALSQSDGAAVIFGACRARNAGEAQSRAEYFAGIDSGPFCRSFRGAGQKLVV